MGLRSVLALRIGLNRARNPPKTPPKPPLQKNQNVNKLIRTATLPSPLGKSFIFFRFVATNVLINPAKKTKQNTQKSIQIHGI